jgi:hypothetical protein
MVLKRRGELAPYRTGDLVGIKSKETGNVYWFFQGSDITFEDVHWTRKSRGVFRGGIDRVRFTRCVVDRGPDVQGQTPCLSTPDGGPQIGQPNDPSTQDNWVENCRFVATGDDSIAFFNASGTVRGNSVRDSFGRGILLVNSPDALVEDNQVVRCPVLRQTRPHDDEEEP